MSNVLDLPAETFGLRVQTIFILLPGEPPGCRSNRFRWRNFAGPIFENLTTTGINEKKKWEDLLENGPTSDGRSIFFEDTGASNTHALKA